MKTKFITSFNLSKNLADLIHAQMIAHQTQNATDYEAKVTKGFITLRSNNYSVEAHESIRNFRTPVDNRQNIRSMHFGGFSKCLYPTQKFDSDSERRLAIVLEEDRDVLKWFKPNKGQFKIYLSENGSYEPDFVVETNGGKFLCEVKRADNVTDAEVEDKANAARKWCDYAARHEAENGGKPWCYILIPHNAIFTNSTFAGIASGNS